MHQAANTDLLWKQSLYKFYYIHKYGTDCTLPLCTFYRPISTAPMMIQPLQNDPMIRLQHYWYQYYTQAPLLPYEPNPTKTDYIAPACQSGWHLNGPTAADYQPTWSKQPTHCDDYTTVLSSIPWNLLPHQQQPILIPNPTGIAVDDNQVPGTAYPWLLNCNDKPNTCWRSATWAEVLLKNSTICDCSILACLPTSPNHKIQRVDTNLAYLLLQSALFSPTKTSHFWQELTPTTLAFMSPSNSVSLSCHANGTCDNTIIRVTFFICSNTPETSFQATLQQW